MTEEERLRIYDRMQADPNDRHHGTNAGYKVYKCRCVACKLFWNEKARKNRLAAKSKSVPDEAHGTMTGYTYYGCRCEWCAAAKAEEPSRYRYKRARDDRRRMSARRRHRLATNKTIVEGVLAKYAGDEREEVKKLLMKAAALARNDERELTMKKLREKREWISQAPVEGKVERFKKQWTLKAIDSLTSVL